MNQKTFDLLLFNFLAIVCGLVCSGLMLLILNEDPIRIFGILFTSVMRDKFTIADIFVKATPLIFTALAFAVTFKANLFNIGAQGQFYIGAVIAVASSLFFENFMPPVIGLILIFLLTLLGGGLYGAFIGFVKARLNANEFLVSMMSTYVALAVMNYLLRTFLMETKGEYPQTDTIQSHYRLPVFMNETRLHIGFIIAVAIAVLIWVILYKTSLGYRIRAVGYNRNASQLAGVNTRRVFIIAFFISGALAALAGYTEINGSQYMLLQGFNTTIGATGIGIAILSNANPIGIIFSSILFGALIVGGNILGQVTNIPPSIIPLMEGYVMIFVLVAYFVRMKVESRREKRRLQKAVNT